jgi:hypothetical protein
LALDSRNCLLHVSKLTQLKADGFRKQKVGKEGKKEIERKNKVKRNTKGRHKQRRNTDRIVR